MTAKRSGSVFAEPSSERPARVLLDTNALFLPFTSSIRLESAIEQVVGPAGIGVPRSVLGEVRALVARAVPNASAAATLARRYSVVRTDRRGDDGVLDAARRFDAWVLTSDRALRDRLRHSGIGVLYPRGRTALVALPPFPPQTVKNRGPLAASRNGRRGDDDRRGPVARPSQPRVRQRRHRGL